MFDVGFTEIVLIALVALVVLGPERMPKAARFAGLWVRRARAQWFSVKSELERELAAEELQRSLRDTRQAAQSIEDEIRSAEAAARREFEAMRGEVVAESGEPPAVEPPSTDDATHETPRADAPDDGATPTTEGSDDERR